MRIAFVWDWEMKAIEQTVTWEDGLAAALKELQNRGHTVDVYADTTEDIQHPYFMIQPIDALMKADVILHWADFTRPHAEPLKKLGIPMAICFAGGATDGPTVGCFDHIFVESEIYWAKLKADGKPVSIAFGTNTDLFVPVTQPKVFDTIFPATFARWKRHQLYAEATQGLKSLAVGYMYDDHEQDCWQTCIDHGVTVLPHVSARVLHRLYAASKICVITSQSDGGSQRTVLEAMAMNMPVIVTDSDKFDWAAERIYRCDPNPQELRSYINTLLDGEPDVNTRDFVVNNWSHINYADALEEELLKLSHR